MECCLILQSALLGQTITKKDIFDILRNTADRRIPLFLCTSCQETSANNVDYWFKEALQRAPTNVRIYQNDCQHYPSICAWEEDTHKSRSDVDNICNNILALE